MTERTPVVLASASPRRSDLIALLDIPFEVEVSHVLETLPSRHRVPAKLAVRLARLKALDVAARRPGRIVVGADTIVVLGESILGKPGSPSDACRMLQALSGRQHRVITGLAVVGGSAGLPVDLGFASTFVRFRTLSQPEIDAYINSGEPFGKAGAYAIQGRGAVLISGIRGDYWNVVGLPLCLLAEMLNRAGVRVELYQPASLGACASAHR